MKFNRKWTVGAVIGACLIAGVALWKTNAKPATKYATAAVTVGDLEQTVLAVGRLHAKELVSVGAQVSGQVKRLNVELGQQVKAGDLIAEVDAQPQRIKLRNAVLFPVRSLASFRGLHPPPGSPGVTGTSKGDWAHRPDVSA
jgi:macrolide-specific efflux system membrane fusion protein